MSTKLKGQYGFPVAVSMVVGIVIGIGIFFKTDQILLATDLNPNAAITAWILGGIISVFSALVFCSFYCCYSFRIVFLQTEVGSMMLKLILITFNSSIKTHIC